MTTPPTNLERYRAAEQRKTDLREVTAAVEAERVAAIHGMWDAEDLSYRTIAEITGIKPSTVRNILKLHPDYERIAKRHLHAPKNRRKPAPSTVQAHL